jgi:hypothetical protein
MNLPRIGAALAKEGFISSASHWENMTEAELEAQFEAKGFSEKITLKPVEPEDPEKRRRIKEMRQARRAVANG